MKRKTIIRTIDGINYTFSDIERLIRNDIASNHPEIIITNQTNVKMFANKNDIYAESDHPTLIKIDVEFDYSEIVVQIENQSVSVV